MKNPNNDQVGLLLYQNTLKEIDALIADGGCFSTEDFDENKNSNLISTKVDGKLIISYKNQRAYKTGQAFETSNINKGQLQQRLRIAIGIIFSKTKAYSIDFLIRIRNLIYSKID